MKIQLLHNKLLISKRLVNNTLLIYLKNWIKNVNIKKMSWIQKELKDCFTGCLRWNFKLKLPSIKMLNSLIISYLRTHIYYYKIKFCAKEFKRVISIL